jgi:hypothetical protein
VKAEEVRQLLGIDAAEATVLQDIVSSGQFKLEQDVESAEEAFF